MIKVYFTLLMTGIILISFFPQSYAQQTGSATIGTELESIGRLYKNAEQLSFDVFYRYSDEKKPFEFLDSLAGNFKLNGSATWCKIDHTEFINNAEYSIALFAEDNLMYVNKPIGNRMTFNPVQAFDSLFSAAIGIKGRIEETATQKKITLEFPATAIYKTIQFFINRQTGLLDKIVHVVQAAQLYDPSVRNLLSEKNGFVIVETSFHNYQHGKFAPDCFDSNHYFRRQGSELVSTAPYSNYKVFIGNIDLQ